MEKRVVKVFSTNESKPLGFKPIGKLEHVETLNADDIILVVDKNGNGDINNVEIRELAEFFSNVNVNAQWYLPKVNGSVISFEWSELTSEHPAPIDIMDLIPLASETGYGLMNPNDYAKLNKIVPYTVDGITIKADKNGVISAIGGTPTCRKITLTASGWDIDSKTQFVSMEIDTRNRNIVDVPPAYVQAFANYRIMAINEDSNGITFQCDTIPMVDIECYVTSMGVISDAN